MCYALWGDHDVEWEGVMPSINSASGMISIWNKDVFVLQNSFSGYEFLGLEGIWKGGNSHITIVNVYSTCALEGKRILC